MLTNSDCTIYLYFYDEIEKVGGYKKHYIPDCYWEESIGERVTKNGQGASNSLFFCIENPSIIPKSPTRDIVIKGYCDFDFDNASEATVSNSFKSLRKKYDFKTIMSCELLNFGELPHLEIHAV